MKIAFINLYQGKVNRGAETFVSDLSKRLSKDNKVDVIGGGARALPRWPFLWRFFLDPNGIVVGWFTLKNIPKILKEKYDVIIPLNGGWQVGLVRIITWLYGGKMVISGQSGVGWDDRNNLWSFPDCFVSISSKALDWAKRANPFVRVEHIPNGVDLNKFSPGGDKIKISLKGPIILCVAALTAQKRINLAIDAAALLGDSSLMVIGDGELKDELEVYGKAKLGSRFSILSFRHDDMPKVYRAVDVFTLPSSPMHSFEIAIIEAMATNLPVVVTDDPIRREIVGNSGIFTNPTDIKDYSLCLKKASNLNLGGAPRREAENYDWNKIAESYNKLFKSIITK
ncbi:glycosyltransferase family 4 protein [Candidatus Woesebacteria bacterium]|nr:glycosyltransferase family 4 protein [Candidatus Woesebacteria bacterium]